MSNHFENHNSNIGMQGENLTNNSEINIFKQHDLNQDTELIKYLNELELEIRENHNLQKNLDMVDSLKDAQKSNNHDKFKNYFDMLVKSVNLIPVLYEIKNLFN